MEKTENLQQPRRSEFSERLLFDSSPITTSATKKIPFYSKSWKEKAITEDSESFLGGYIWPPRSYSCNFCTREFSSAQALGGHMNIHRRDRARLKQEEEDHQDSILYKSCVTHTDQNSNPNYSYSFDHSFSSSLAPDSLADHCLALRLKRGFDEEEEKKRLNSKRRKDLICCFVKSVNLSGEELQEFESEVTNLSLRHVGELDLELRLGRSTA